MEKNGEQGERLCLLETPNMVAVARTGRSQAGNLECLPGLPILRLWAVLLPSWNSNRSRITSGAAGAHADDACLRCCYHRHHCDPQCAFLISGPLRVTEVTFRIATEGLRRWSAPCLCRPWGALSSPLCSVLSPGSVSRLAKPKTVSQGWEC